MFYLEHTFPVKPSPNANLAAADPAATLDTLAASKTPLTDFLVKLAVPTGAGAALGTLMGLFGWLLAPAYWAVVGFIFGRRVEGVERGDASVWALWGGFLGAIGLSLLWVLEYERLL